MGLRRREHRDHNKSRWFTELCRWLTNSCAQDTFLSGCNPGEFTTPLLITLPQYEALATAHRVLQPPWRPQNIPVLQALCPDGVLLSLVTASSLICASFCSTALITERPNYRSTELPLAHPDGMTFKIQAEGHACIHPKSPRLLFYKVCTNQSRALGFGGQAVLSIRITHRWYVCDTTYSSCYILRICNFPPC